MRALGYAKPPPNLQFYCNILALPRQYGVLWTLVLTHRKSRMVPYRYIRPTQSRVGTAHHWLEPLSLRWWAMPTLRLLTMLQEAE